MVQQDGKAVLIDFGIAGEIIPKTVSSKVFANPAFAPYEQMRGDRKPSVDIYSLAASLYYAVTGKFPEAAINRRLYSMALVSPQEHISSISDRLNQAILKGMELEPENRPQTMQEWLELLADEVVTTWTSGYQLQNGKYTIERDIAQGGFGITYLARDENHQRVVIKTLNEIVQRHPDFAKLQQDFVNEAVKLAKCNHPHIVKVNEVFQEGKLWCIAMEYIEGEHLADRVVNGGVLSEAEAVGYIRQIGEALTVVHNSGLLHRDVKPANIIVRSNQREAVLIDFGIAREFTPNVTKLHTANLSHCFAPIEQYQTVSKRGAYTDVYALAATLYFLVTNRLPHPAITRASGVVLEEPKSINPSISSRVNQAILKGMELEPEERPQTMQAWLELLKEPPTQSNTLLKKNQYQRANILQSLTSYLYNVLIKKKFIFIISSALIVMLAGLLIYYINREKPRIEQVQPSQDADSKSATQSDYFLRYDFSKFFPSSDSEFKIVSSETTRYHLKFFMKKDVKIVAALSISDIEDNNPYPANFANSTKKIAGYPSIVDINNTMILVGRFEVRVRSMDSSFTASDRVEWIQKFDLSGLSKCSVEVSDALLKKCGVPKSVDDL